MMRAAHHSSVWQARAFIALALLSMLVRVVIPQGFMLDAPNAKGEFVSIRICSSHGQIAAFLDLATGAIIDGAAKGADGSQKSGNADAPCIFSAIAHLAAPISPALIIAISAATRPAEFFLPITAPGRGLAAPPPWSTGPPSRS